MKKIKIVKCIACNGKGKVKRIDRGKITDRQKNEILKMYRSGKGIREIQRALKIRNPMSVTHYIRTCNNK